MQTGHEGPARRVVLVLVLVLIGVMLIGVVGVGGGVVESNSVVLQYCLWLHV